MMAGSITLLPIFEQDQDRKDYAKLSPPKSMVVRYGYQKLIAELPYEGTDKPGCGSKLVVRTTRGNEIGEMLTTTCGNGGCGHSVTRKQMLQYIENSGGKDYPFETKGKVVRVANTEDLLEQAHLDQGKKPMLKFARSLIEQLNVAMKLVDIERLLGGERVIFYYTADKWVDFRELVRKLASEYQTRIEMHQLNEREEARLVADYERCGQHCCCKQFLKVLKPISMRSAKVQKATLDPTKISGRCGRLMCCLRYEDETYETLRRKLPHKQSRMMTEDGPGTVVGSQILTQLVMIRLDHIPAPAAYPLENLRKLTKEEETAIKESAQVAQENTRPRGRSDMFHRNKPQQNRPTTTKPTASNSTNQTKSNVPSDRPAQQADQLSHQANAEGDSPPSPQTQEQGQGQSSDQEDSEPKRKRRRRRRRKKKDS